MNHAMQPIDFAVFFIYFAIVTLYGYWVYQKKKNGIIVSSWHWPALCGAIPQK